MGYVRPPIVSFSADAPPPRCWFVGVWVVFVGSLAEHCAACCLVWMVWMAVGM